MWCPLLSILAVVSVASATCPTGWLPAGTNTICYRLLPVQTYNNSHSARQACLAQGGDLIRLKDVEAHQKAGQLLASTSGTVKVYLGLHFGSAGMKYLDGTASGSYIKNFTGTASGNCVIMSSSNWTDTSTGDWMRKACCTDQSIQHVVCEKPFSSNTTVTQANDKIYQECHSTNPCASNPCQSGGTCSNNAPANTSYTCTCVAGRTGLHCETGVECSQILSNTYSNAAYTAPPTKTPGTQFPITCNTGFSLPDKTTTKTIKCENSGSWTPDIGSGCTKHCPAVPTVSNANAVNPGTAVGLTVNFTCITGFQYPDNTTVMDITCKSDGTWDKDVNNLPKCEIVKCPTIPNYEHQSVNTYNNTFNTTIIFWCDVGYTLSDNTTARTITCTETGAWSAQLPPCTAVKCPIIHPIAKGTRNSTQNTFNDFVEYRCNPGYRMEDGAAWRIIKCDATGLWSDNVTDCDLNRCYPLPYVANATPSTLVAQINQQVKFTCKQGHKFFLTNTKKDHQSIICQNDNGRLRWHPSLRGCEPVQCPVLTAEITSQSLKNLQPLSSQRLYGAVVDIKCFKGHYRADNSTTETVECLSTELWNKTTYEECQPVKCGGAPGMDNGTASQNLYGKTLFQYLDLIYFECKADHKFLDGRKKMNISCNEFGHWNESDLSCRKDRCDPVPRKLNVQPNSTATNWYTIVKYVCQDGFEWTNTAPVIVTCTNTGAWSGDNQLKDCTPKKCPALPTQANSTHNGTKSGSESYVYGDYVEFKCNQGYKYTAANVKAKTISCNANGQWSPATLEPCEPIDCGKLDPIENATLQTNDTIYGIDIVYKCNDGYQFPDKDRQKMVKCEAGENDTMGYYEWFTFKTEDPKKKANHCEVVFCPPVPAWSETEFNSTINEFESVVLYWCKNLYQFKTCVAGTTGFEDCERSHSMISTSTETVEEVTTAALSNDSSGGGGATTREVKRTQSTCIEKKVWDPPFLDCVSIKSIGADVKGVVTESKDGPTFGIFAISLLVCTAVTLVLLDVNKLYTDCKLMKQNIQYFINKKKKNKVSDSSVSIGESTA